MWRDLVTISISCMADVSIISATQDYSQLFCSRTSGGVRSPQSWPSLACWRGVLGGQIAVWCTGRGLRLRRWSLCVTLGQIASPRALGPFIKP